MIAPRVIRPRPAKLLEAHMIRWLSSWATTLHIMVFERDLYRQLCAPVDMDDFVDAPRPETYR